MVNIIICDDNNNDRKRIVTITKNFTNKNKIECNIYVFNDYNEEFNKIMKSNIPFKIYILDIETPSKSGIDIAREIRNKDVDSSIIFLTGHDELGNTVLKNNLLFLSFINKYDDMENRINDSLKRALDSLKYRKILRIVEKSCIYTIDINDILYISKDSYERKTIIKTDYAEIKVGKPLNEIINMLDGRFVQTHRICFINNDRKVKIDKSSKTILFDTGDIIDLLSDKYKKEMC